MLRRALAPRSIALVGFVFAIACSGNAPPKAAGPASGEIDLARPARDRPSWPVGLVPCAKDAPEGSSCAASPASSAASAGTPAPALEATTVWNVPIGPEDPVRGAVDALVTLVVFADFECPFCKKVNPTLERLVTELPGDVRVVWKDLPLPMHANAEGAAELARFARATQGDVGFWKAHDLLYAAQQSLGERTFQRIAGQLGLAWTPAWAAIRAAKFGAVIQADVALSDRVLVEATPTTFVNGVKLVGAQPYERTRELVDAQLAKAHSMLDAGTPRASLYAVISAQGVQIEPRADTQPP